MGEVGGGAQQLQCKSDSAQCSEKHQSPCEGRRVGLNFEKKNAEKNKTTPKKKIGHYIDRFPYIWYFFIHRNQIS